MQNIIASNTGRDQHDYPGQRRERRQPTGDRAAGHEHETNSNATPAMLVTSTLLASIPPAMSKRERRDQVAFGYAHEADPSPS